MKTYYRIDYLEVDPPARKNRYARLEHAIEDAVIHLIQNRMIKSIEIIRNIGGCEILTDFDHSKTTIEIVKEEL